MAESTNKHRWIEKARKNSEVIRGIILAFHPYYDARKHSHKITANDAEKMCEFIRRRIKHETLYDPVAVFVDSLKKGDADTCWKILNEAWFGLPESLETRLIDGFSVFADLCEEYLE